MIYLGSDHAGFKLKHAIKKYLEKNGLDYEDLGNINLDPNDDYPDFGRVVAEKVAENGKNRGILACRNGVGMCLVATKVKGVRGFIPLNVKHARTSRQDDNTNVICFGQDFVTNRQALKILRVWLNARFDTAARHRRRVSKLES